MKAEYICADQPVTSFFACDKAADHTLRLARHSGAIQVLDQSFQSHASFSPFDAKFAQTFGAAFRLTPRNS
jgi:hypothetical protein